MNVMPRIAPRSILDQALPRFDDAARHRQLDRDVLEKLKYPRETTKTRRKDNMEREGDAIWQIATAKQIPLRSAA